ncbi:hypothetical protein BRC85_07490 [Halobacteriales archaeon QS_1_69_70]|nr:MAG: hypothetical protein BRC85_07490 [Halobacteriales archaeon QS_1_69_70]
MDRRAYLATVGAAVTAAVAGCPDGGLSESEFDVGMSANAFLPDTYEANGGGGSIRAGETYEHTFDTPGNHRYFCIPHERDGMTGVVAVSE